MSDFLTYLNTADVNALTQASGVTRGLAANIIAARPFNAVEDCLEVRGMGKNLLARLQSAFEAHGNASESRAMIPVEEEAPAPVEKSQPKAERTPEARPSFGSRVWRGFVNFFWALIRLILAIAIIGGIGAAAYFGVPYVRNNFIAPLEQNRAEIDRLESEVAALEAEVASLQTRLDETNGRVDAVEKSIEAHSAALEKLADVQTALEKEMQDSDEKLALDLKREIVTTRALEFLSRARLYLAQSNFGLARADVQSARDLLAEIQSDAPKYKPALLKQVVSRLDLALGNLPDFPVIAASDVEIAWQLLMSGQPSNVIDATATPTPTQIPTGTPTPESLPSATPTAAP